MNPLITKEIRLVLPAFGLALLLAAVPVWFFDPSLPPSGDMPGVTFFLLCFGALFLALAAFGREFGMGTFPLLLAQPLTRSRIWWTKITVLVCALAAVFAACLLSSAFWNYLNPFPQDWLKPVGGPATLATAFLVIVASGLWTTLLLRQIVAAFWFAVLIPIALLTLILWNGGSILAVQVALVLYSIAGIASAWYQLKHAQEIAWTGGEVNLPDWQPAVTATRSATRAYRPRTALILKEIRLYQVALAGMAGLFVLHLGVIAVRKTLPASSESLTASALSLFGGLWIIVPFVTGALNVADERRLGTLEPHLCLPLSHRVQFAIKLSVMLLLSGVLSAVLLWFAEGIAAAIGIGGGFGGTKITLGGAGLVELIFLFLAVSLIIFFASTLTRNLLQAIVVAVVTLMAFACVGTFLSHISWRINPDLWDGILFPVITVPTMVVAIIWLAYKNFHRLPEPRRLWLRNVGGLVGAILFAATLTTLIFNRVWEFFAPLEPRHGSAILSPSSPPKFLPGYLDLSLLLPDGRLWNERVVYDEGRVIHPFGENFPLCLGGAKWVGQSGGHFLDGADWIDEASLYRETAAIRSDGSLWVSEIPVNPFFWFNDRPAPRPPAPLVQLGNDNRWKRVISTDKDRLLLLKTDGTFWTWENKATNRPPGLVHSQSRRLGSDADWSDILYSAHGTFLWKTDGRAWKLVSPYKNPDDSIVLDDNFVAQRWETFDHLKWQSLAQGWGAQFAVRDDGTLWTFGGNQPGDYRDQYNSAIQKPPVQIGADRDWTSITGDNRHFIGLKRDGTLWKWDIDWRFHSRDWIFSPPTRLGRNSDWVALTRSGNGIWALSADGTLWCWSRDIWGDWLIPSRRPEKFENIFALKDQNP